MTIKGILFDLYGTLIDIETDESREDIYRSIAHFLTYQGISVHRGEVRDHYYEIMKQHNEQSDEEYPEVNVEAVWNTFLREQGLPPSLRRKLLAKTLAQLYRAISRKRLQLHPQVKKVLETLQCGYHLAIISDAQPCYALPEIRAVGLEGYFDPLIFSANYGFRKPDPRLFHQALEIMKLTPPEVLFVGNDMYRDIYGASRLGIKTILVVSHQREQSYRGISADYVANQFEDVLKGIEVLL